ncbi:MAG: VWA domain-containing protein [Planctomycetes bacterium]|nr:VWA domain-containing protein [Planctomycetota bacterium]
MIASPAEWFERPQWWPVLAAVPVFIILALWLNGRRRANIEYFMSAGRAAAVCGDVSNRIRAVRIFVAGAALLFAGIALLDPVFGDEFRVVESRGIDILLCVDVSRSMLARDLPPSRLERAKRDMQALADHVRGDRLGCVAFAGEAKLTIPLTQDMDTFRGLVDPLDPAAVRKGGTDLGKAVDAAVEALDSNIKVKDPALGAHEVILLLTDGEDLEGQGLAAAKRASARGITVHCIGFGDTRGSKITLQEDGSESFLKNERGDEVVSAMDADSLRKLAAATGGEFIRADAMPLPLIELYEKRIVPKAKKTFESEEKREKKHRFQWPLMAALALALIDLGLTDRNGIFTKQSRTA